jgi:NADPH:quinone reductase-like Zn-dependent oxidoreductase
MRAARFEEFGPPSVIRLVDLPSPKPGPDEAVVEVRAAGVNPSDAKNVAGKMPQTRLPRTPGRDFAGVVSAGPPEWQGAEVWLTGGEFGFTRDGGHAQEVLVPVAALRRKPARLSFADAAAVGTPFLTALVGLKRAGLARGNTVLVVGAAGAVGGAAIQIATWRGARAIGLVLDDQQAETARSLGAAEVIVVPRGDDPAPALAKALGTTVDLAFDTTGYALDACVHVLAHAGRAVAIAAPPDGKTTFDLRALYRRDGQILGIDSLKVSCREAVAILDELAPGFDSGALHPPRFTERPLHDIVTAYQLRGKVVLVP